MDQSIDARHVLAPTGALLSAQIAVSAAIERLAVDRSEMDSTTTDLLLRISLSPSGSLRGVDLCRQLQLSPSYISRRIDRAEADGLVQRLADPDDRRAQLIALTDAGRRNIDAFTPRLLDVIDRLVDGLSPSEIGTLIDLLGRVESAANAELQPARAAAAAAPACGDLESAAWNHRLLSE